MIIGLTGGLATGKTTIATLLAKDGYVILDADSITHNLYESNNNVRNIILKLYPNAVTEKAVDRIILAREVTQNPTLLPQLEKEMHPLIIQEIEYQISLYNTHPKPVILTAPLLFETGLERICDYVICLYADLNSQRTRAMERQHMTHTKFDTLVARQWTNGMRRKKSDLWVSTDTSVQETYQTIIAFLETLNR